MSRRNAFATVLLAVVLACLPLVTQAAEPAMDRIARTGVLRAATRDDAPPFAFRTPDGKLAGLSVDLIEEIRAALARKLNRPIRTETLIVSSANRIAAITEGRAEIDCETATVTWGREQNVDFTLPIFRDGTRVLTYRDTLDRMRDLGAMRIGVVDGAVTGRVVLRRLPDATIVTFPNMPAALRGLEAGEVDGIANVGIVLRGLLETATKRQGLVIVPRGEALGYENIACMLPENDSQWRDFVNGVLRELYQGVEGWRGGYIVLYDRWFGRGATIPYPLDERTAQFLAAMLVWLD